jgi:hypothetical protein
MQNDPRPILFLGASIVVKIRLGIAVDQKWACNGLAKVGVLRDSHNLNFNTV